MAVKINPRYEQVLMIMAQCNGLTKNQMLSYVNQKEFYNYCNERYGERPMFYRGGKYRMTVTELDRAYQAKRLGGVMKGFAKSVKKQVVHIIDTTEDNFVKELGAMLSIFPKSSIRKYR